MRATNLILSVSTSDASVIESYPAANMRPYHRMLYVFHEFHPDLNSPSMLVTRFLETSFHAVPQQHQPNSIRNHNYSNGRTAPSSDLSRTFCNQTRTAEECGIRVNGRAFCNTLKISVACCMCPECLSGCQRRRQRLISLSSRVVSNSNTACTLASPSDIVASVGGLAIEQSSIPFCLKAKRQRKTNYFCLTILLASLSHSLSFFILYARGP